MTFRIALAQCESQIGTASFDPRRANLDRAEAAAKDAVARGAQIVLFGEMFLTGYRTDEANPIWALRLDEHDETLDEVVELSARHGVHLMIGAATVRAGAPSVVHNSAILVGPTGVLATYDKLHVGVMTMPDGTEIDEARWFSPGSEVQVWETEFGTLGPQICYDLSFPEISRLQSVNGAEVLVNISASAAGFEESLHHTRLVRARENAAWYVVCSIVGEQKDDRFFGRSSVVHPSGELIVEAADGVEDLVVADINPAESAGWRARMNHLRARRPEAYSKVTRPVVTPLPSPAP
jgi:predicted amidohydrolase